MRRARLNSRGPAFALVFLAGALRGEELWVAHNQIVVIDAPTRKKVATIPLDEVVNGIAFAKDGSRAFVGTSGGKDPAASRGGLYVIDAATRRVLSKVLSDPVKELRMSPDGRRLHLLEWRVRAPEKEGRKRKPLAEPFRLRTLDVSSGEPRSAGTVTAGLDLYDLAVSPDGKTVYLHDPGHNQLRVMDLSTGVFVDIWELAGGKKDDGTRFEAAPAKLALDAKGARAAVLQAGAARSGVMLVDLDARTRRQILLQNGSNIRAGRFLPDGKRLAAVAMERLLVIDLESEKLLKAVPLKGTFTTLAVSESGELYLGAPVALRGEAPGGMIEARDGESYEYLARIPLSTTAKLLAIAPPRPAAER